MIRAEASYCINLLIICISTGCESNLLIAEARPAAKSDRDIIYKMIYHSKLELERDWAGTWL